jgi:hypothetical protein
MSSSYGMGRRRRPRRRRHGGAFWDDVKNAFSQAHDFVKRNKLISRVASIIPHPAAQGISTAAGILGYGRRRRVVRRRPRMGLGGRRHSSLASAIGLGRRRRVGRPRVRRMGRGGARLSLGALHKFVKEKKLISSALRHFLPNSHLHRVASLAGYGRRRRAGRPRVHRRRIGYGGNNIFDTQQLAVSKF